MKQFVAFVLFCWCEGGRYNFDSMGTEDFLQYNRAELRAIATGNNSEKKKWLKDFLNTWEKSAIKEELLPLLH